MEERASAARWGRLGGSTEDTSESTNWRLAFETVELLLDGPWSQLHQSQGLRQG